MNPKRHLAVGITGAVMISGGWLIIEYLPLWLWWLALAMVVAANLTWSRWLDHLPALADPAGPGLYDGGPLAIHLIHAPQWTYTRPAVIPGTIVDGAQEPPGAALPARVPFPPHDHSGGARCRACARAVGLAAALGAHATEAAEVSERIAHTGDMDLAALMATVAAECAALDADTEAYLAAMRQGAADFRQHVVRWN